MDTYLKKHPQETMMNSKELNMTPDSSVIAGHAYVDDTLLVAFKSGSVYSYEGVAEALYLELRAAESVGKFYNSKIKGYYTCEKH